MGSENFGTQFYPTPPELVRTMLDKIEWQDVKSILEPSVGKGNIITYFNDNKYGYCGGRVPKWFGFEIDLNLRKLVDNKCELIGFGFLRIGR